jgi:hypothetical protein
MTKCKICKESEEVTKIKHIGYVCEDCIPELYELIEKGSDELFGKYVYPDISKIIIKELDKGTLSDWIMKNAKTGNVGNIFRIIDDMMFSDEIDSEIKSGLMTVFEDTYEEVDIE